MDVISASPKSPKKSKNNDDSLGYNIRIITGNSNPKLATQISEKLGIHIEPCQVGTFADGELDIQCTNVRGSDVFIVQPACPPHVHHNLMELLLLIHTLKLASAKRITAIVPYFCYARQDRKTKPRVPISASAVAQLIEKMGPTRVVTVDLHCGQIQGFFHKTPVDNLFAEPIIVKYLKRKNFPLDKLIIVSPDAGGVVRARRLADRLGAAAVIAILKRRTTANQIEQMQIVGDVNGSICVIVDDIIDTAGTLVGAAELLKENGATRVLACATHGIFSGPAIDRLNQSILEEICVTDSIPQEKNLQLCKKLICLSLVPLLAKAIQHLHDEKSLSILFEPLINK